MVSIPGKYDQEDFASLDSAGNGFSPILTGFDIAWCIPATDLICLQWCDDAIRYSFIFRRITYKNIIRYFLSSTQLYIFSSQPIYIIAFFTYFSKKDKQKDLNIISRIGLFL